MKKSSKLIKKTTFRHSIIKSEKITHHKKYFKMQNFLTLEFSNPRKISNPRNFKPSKSFKPSKFQTLENFKFQIDFFRTFVVHTCGPKVFQRIKII